MVTLDIAVVGGGPAGGATALCLARMGWRVAIFESTAFDTERFGETLPPEINPVLRRLNVWEPFLASSPLESPGVVSTWGSAIPVEADFVTNAFGCGWHINRRLFDQALCHQAVAEGATLFVNRRMNWKQRGCGWEADNIHANFLVDATGRHGLMPGGRTTRVREDSMLAVVMHLSDGRHALRDQRTWIEAVPSGWWYSTLLPDGSGLAMFFTGAEIYREFGISIQEQLQAAPLVRSRLRDSRVAPIEIVYAPSGHSQTMFGTSWAAVGDSASSYDPLSGQGIFKALRQGESLAQSINALLCGDPHALELYAAQVRAQFDVYAERRQQLYSAERRWRHNPFWKRRGC
jgi:flavin-dependent dehydrogenase